MNNILHELWKTKNSKKLSSKEKEDKLTILAVQQYLCNLFYKKQEEANFFLSKTIETHNINTPMEDILNLAKEMKHDFDLNERNARIKEMQDERHDNKNNKEKASQLKDLLGKIWFRIKPRKKYGTKSKFLQKKRRIEDLIQQVNDGKINQLWLKRKDYDAVNEIRVNNY